MSIQEKRLENVNEFIQIIASCGRKFFSHNGFISTMEMDERGRIWFLDYYTKKRIYTHYKHEWRAFTSGGTLRRLVELFRDHIKKGTHMSPRYFETRDHWCSGHPWGYPHDDLAMLEQEARRLGIIRPTHNGGESE